MAYCTKQDLIVRFGIDELIQLTDPEVESVNDDTISRAITDAEATINAHLQVRYTLPLPNVPAFLTRVACEIARYMLYQDRATEEVTRRYEGAMKTLESLARGTLGVDADDGSPSLGSPEIMAGDRVFTRESTQGF